MSLVFNLLVYSPKNTCVSALHSYSTIWGKVWLPGAGAAEKQTICYTGDELPNRTGGRKCLEWVTSLLFSVSEIPNPLSHIINGIFSSLIFFPVLVFFTPTLINFKMFTCLFCLWELSFSLWTEDDFGSPENSNPIQVFTLVRDKALPVRQIPWPNLQCGLWFLLWEPKISFTWHQITGALSILETGVVQSF